MADIYLTKITLEVLSDGPLDHTMSLEEILRECDQGACVGGSMTQEPGTLFGTTGQVIEALKAIGNDGEFFGDLPVYVAYHRLWDSLQDGTAMLLDARNDHEALEQAVVRFGDELIELSVSTWDGRGAVREIFNKLEDGQDDLQALMADETLKTRNVFWREPVPSQGSPGYDHAAGYPD